ncbi:MAG: TIGR02584 family CRISPR-associated protein [Verrucomicrobia bacterium]|nr:TIGR02584 family CRISPR-associated protein [Verrucomicrobiota bacterium]
MKTILITVSGMSPAIITETVWALSRETPAVIPDEVIVITTVPGREGIERQLLSPRPDWGNLTVWESLRRAIFSRHSLAGDGPRLLMSPRVIQLADPAQGVKRDALDTRTPADNLDTADFILQILSPFVDSADQRVIASIAGGRKTMGALLYACMSLIGRESDRVTHVLVNDPFDRCRDFFYPDQPVQEMVLDGGQVTAAQARIELADLPFVPLRNGFVDLNEPRRSFAGMVDRYSREIRYIAGPPVVDVDEKRGIIKINGKPIKIPQGRASLLARFLWESARDARTFVDRQDAAEAWSAWIEVWRQQNKLLASKLSLARTVDVQDVGHGLNSIREALREHHLEAYTDYLVPLRSVGFKIRFPLAS